MKGKRYELFLALRYLKARRKQAFTSIVSFVSILGIAVGVAALVIALALLTGFQQDIQAKIIGANAHIVIWGAGDAPMGEYREVASRVREVSGVRGAGGVVLRQAAINTSYGQTFAMFKGIDTEAATTDLLDRLVEGSAADLRVRGETDGVIVGRDMADKLLLRIGDYIEVMVYDPNMITPMAVGWFRSRRLRVAGIFEAGMYEYDNNWALVDLRTAQEMFYRSATNEGTDGSRADVVTFVEVRVDDIYATDALMEDIRERLDGDYVMTDWKNMNAVFFSALQLERLAMFVTISLIVFVAALNIVATLVLMVMEKNRDIGILLSMGATRRGILYTFILQGLFIGLMGTVTGLTLGIGVSYVADRYQLISLQESVYYLSHVPFVVRPLDFTVIALMAVAVSFLATLYPAWRASRLDPVEALRYE
jgi:lipoprotein-releasing system permease protein